MHVTIGTKRPFTVIGRAKSVGADAMEQIPVFWDQCHAEGFFDVFGQWDLPTGHCYGLCCDMTDEHGPWTYLVCFEPKPEAPLPDGWVRREFDGGTYAALTVRGVPPKCIHDGWTYLHTTWMPESGYEYDSAAVAFERYGENSGHDDERFECEIWMPVKPKG